MRRSRTRTPRVPLAVRLTSERNIRINERFTARARLQSDGTRSLERAK